jgi:M6 family metalloprotease-like protein
MFSRSPDVESFKPAIARRKNQLVQAMRTDPEAALENVLSEKEQSDAQVISENCVEEFTTIEGLLQSYVIDYTDQTSETVYSVTTESGDEVVIHPTEEIHEVPSNTEVRLAGYKLDQEILVDNQNSANFEVVQAASQSHAMGNQKIAVILVRMQNSLPSTITREQIDGAIMNNANNYYKENSYGKTDLSWTTFGWYTVPQMSTCDPNLTLSNALQAANTDVNFRDYSRIIVFASDMTTLNCPFDGLGNVGVAPKQTPDGVVTNSMTLVAMKNNTSTVPIMSLVVAHELGHNMGVHHASALNCGSQSLATSGCSYQNNPQLEYGDLFNVMGNRVAHMSAPHKEFIGWLPANQVQEVNSSGSYTILPMANSGTGLKAIKIPRGNGDYLYIEYRQPIGFDSQIGNVANSDIFQGALLHTLASPNQTLLIDASPPMEIPFTFSPALLPNRAFTDPVTGVSVMVTSVATSGLTVQVAYPGTTLPPVTIPTVTVSPTIIPSISVTPSLSPSQIPVTPTVSTSPSPTVSPTPIHVGVKMSFKLRGVDSTTQVTNSTVSLKGKVYDPQNILMHSFTGTATYNPQTKSFDTNEINFPLVPAQYSLLVTLSNTLAMKSTVLSLNGGINTLPPINIIAGDFNGDNQITMSDHSYLVRCYGTKSCSNKSNYDLNFDGVVNGIDYNIFIANLLQKRNGD